MNKISSALVLIRTPFQAWVFKKIIIAEQLSQFDFLYFSQDLSEEDYFYFRQIARKSRRSKFIYEPRHKFSILNNIKFFIKGKKFIKDRTYHTVFISSIDSFSINALAYKSKFDKLVTFDDGAANIDKRGTYFNDFSCFRSVFYMKILGAKQINTIRSRIDRHYSIYQNIENIVENEKVISVKGWSKDEANSLIGTKKTYFIGGPFEESLNKNQITRLENYLKKIHIDKYVKHPRERTPLAIGVSFLEKKGRIAEDAIVSDADGKSIVLVGYLSSVLFNLSSYASRTILLVPEASDENNDLLEIATQLGCEVIVID